MTKFVISLGGSIVAPKTGPDGKFVLKFAQMIKKLARGRHFFISIGGGKINRNYNSAAKRAGVTSKDDLDRIGLRATQLNAQFIAAIIATKVKVQLLQSITENFKKGFVVVSGGFPPLGKSTDYIALELARRAGAKRLVNLSNIDFVYDRDPKKFKNAEPKKSLSWKQFRQICGGEWRPGINSPFDPVASKYAQKLGLEVIIANGHSLANFEKIVLGKPFRGTTIY